MLVLGLNEGDKITIKLEDGRLIEIFPKLRKVGIGDIPNRFGIAVDAPKSIRIDRIKEAYEKENN
jgi:sRNA-binding carbon storage regulator CsrA